MKKVLILIGGICLGVILAIVVLVCVNTYNANREKLDYNNSIDNDSLEYVIESIDNTETEEEYYDTEYEEYGEEYYLEFESFEDSYEIIYNEEVDFESDIDTAYFNNLDTEFKGALTYFKDNVGRLSAFWFWNNYDYTHHPDYVKLDNTGKILWLFPFSYRHLGLNEYKGTKTKYEDYKTIIELLSQNRKTVNFVEVYNLFKSQIHTIIDKDTYSEKYADLVTRLLIAYEDMDSEEKYEQVNEIMFTHFKNNHVMNEEYSSTDLEWFFHKLERIMSDEAKNKLKNMTYPIETGDNGSYTLNYGTIWTYSFWNRRKMEGKKEEIYKLLKTIEKDYANMGEM